MNAVVGTKAKIMKRDPAASTKIPYSVHLTEHTIQTKNRDYLQVIRLTGASFESADDEDVNIWHKRLNGLLKNISSHNIAIWQHIVRRRESKYPAGEFPEGFAKELDEKYARRLSGERLRVNELYLTVVYRPYTSFVSRGLFGLMSKGDKSAIEAERNEALDKLNKVVTQITRNLRRYEAERLGVYQHCGVYCSEPMEFMGFLLNGKWRRVALAQAPLKSLLPNSRPFFGTETIEIRSSTDTLYGAMLGINSYPPDTTPVFLNELLTAPFDFVLTQSFSFIKQETARGRMKRAQNRMSNAQDDAVSQTDEIDDALDDLASRRWVMGEHHFSLFIKSSSIKALNDYIADAENIMSDAGITTAREDLAIASAYWAQLPANFKDRPRVSGINSKNFAGFAPMHNFPAGRLKNNHWGDALSMLMTTAGTPYYFSFHASDPADVNDAKVKDVGHTLVIGPTGSGKTVWVTFHLCMLVKHKATCILFSKDRDTEIAIRALGGRYYSIRNGQPTNWNYFLLDDNDPLSRPFVKELTLYLAAPQGRVSDLNVEELNSVERAVNSVLNLDRQYRRLGRVLDYLTKDTPVYARLARWCYSREEGRPHGENAWVFDNKDDTLAASLGESLITGFDVTDFLDNAELRTPINMYLFHITKALLDGRRLALFIAEFWKALGDAPFQAFAEDHLRTMRKKNGFVVLDSQSPNDALKSPIAHTLIEQTPTKIIFPNDKAIYEQYKTLGLSDREFEIIKESDPEATRMFLIKQGHSSVFASLDLEGFKYELDVLSSKPHNLELVERLMKEHGAAPDNWLPHFKNADRKKP